MSASIVVRKLSFWAFVAFLVAYVGILSMAMFVFQFGLGELPCPLCILQRMGMMLASLGALYVVVRALRGDRPGASDPRCRRGRGDLHTADPAPHPAR